MKLQSSKYLSDWNKRPNVFFNKYINLKKYIINNYRVRKSIDRIQISIRNRVGVFEYIYYEFKKQFGFKRVKKVKAKKREGLKTIYEFMYQKSKIEIITHPPYLDEKGEVYKYPEWFSVSIYDAYIPVQRIVRDIFRRKRDIYVSLSQVEFAVDFFPKNKMNMTESLNILSYGLVLKHSRANSYNQCKTTGYQGREGYVREGSKGLRYYYKEELGCIRIELQANKGFLNNMGICSLPVTPEDINISDHVQCRDGFDESTFNKLADLIIKLKLKAYTITDSARSMRHLRMIESVVRESTLDAIREEDYPYSDAFDERGMMPVAVQIDVFKKLKKHFGLTHQVDYFFPKKEWLN